MLQHISDESFFNMALDALSNGLKYANNLVFSGMSKWNQAKGVYIYIYFLFYFFFVVVVLRDGIVDIPLII